MATPRNCRHSPASRGSRLRGSLWPRSGPSLLPSPGPNFGPNLRLALRSRWGIARTRKPLARYRAAAGNIVLGPGVGHTIRAPAAVCGRQGEQIFVINHSVFIWNLWGHCPARDAARRSPSCRNCVVQRGAVRSGKASTIFNLPLRIKALGAVPAGGLVLRGSAVFDLRMVRRIGAGYRAAPGSRKPEERHAIAACRWASILSRKPVVVSHF